MRTYQELLWRSIYNCANHAVDEGKQLKEVMSTRIVDSHACIQQHINVSLHIVSQPCFFVTSTFILSMGPLPGPLYYCFIYNLFPTIVISELDDS